MPDAPADPCPRWPRDLWHRTRVARDLLHALDAGDMRLVRQRPVPGPDRLAWMPCGAHGAAIIAALDALREASVAPALHAAVDAAARSAALAAASRVPSVQRVLALRFGDPARWHGLDPADATRRFRTWWHGRQALRRKADPQARSAPGTRAPPG